MNIYFMAEWKEGILHNHVFISRTTENMSLYHIQYTTYIGMYVLESDMRQRSHNIFLMRLWNSCLVYFSMSVGGNVKKANCRLPEPANQTILTLIIKIKNK